MTREWSPALRGASLTYVGTDARPHPLVQPQQRPPLSVAVNIKSMKHTLLIPLLALPCAAVQMWQADFRDTQGVTRATMTYNDETNVAELTTLSPWSRPYAAWHPPGAPSYLYFFMGLTTSWTIPDSWEPEPGRTSTELLLWQNMRCELVHERYEADFYQVPEPTAYAVVCGLGLVAFAAWRRNA